MSSERVLAVRMPVDSILSDMLRDVESAHRRAGKSEPGDRTDVVSYEALSAALELRAVTSLFDGSGIQQEALDPGMVTAGLFVRDGDAVVISVTLPLEEGATARDAAGVSAPEPATPVELRDDIRGRRLVLARFREQLVEAISDPDKDRGTGLNPSGIHNRVLTEVLREYVDRQGKASVSVPVVYRDGSRASEDFPFHCLDFTSSLTSDSHARAGGILILRLALLSIRHTEMDAVVDGAWLRNAEVSKPRTAAQTDDYVYVQSVKQLLELTRDGRLRVRLYMFQTGLETAVVGFLRAVIDVLVRHPGSLEVVPMFYAKNPRSRVDPADEFAGYEPGAPWATALPSGWAR